MNGKILLNPVSRLPHQCSFQPPGAYPNPLPPEPSWVTVTLHSSPLWSCIHNALSSLAWFQPLVSTLSQCPAGVHDSSWLPVSGTGPVGSGWAGFCSWTTAVVSAMPGRMGDRTLWRNLSAEGRVEGDVFVCSGRGCWMGAENLQLPSLTPSLRGTVWGKGLYYPRPS